MTAWPITCAPPGFATEYFRLMCERATSGHSVIAKAAMREDVVTAMGAKIVAVGQPRMRLQTASGSETIGAYWIVGDGWEVGLDGFYIGLLLERDVGAVLPKADDRAAGLEMSATAIVEVPSR